MILIVPCKNLKPSLHSAPFGTVYHECICSSGPRTSATFELVSFLGSNKALSDVHGGLSKPFSSLIPISITELFQNRHQLDQNLLF